MNLNNFSTSLTNTIIKWRWLVVILSILIVGYSGSGARFLTFDTNYRVFFGEENPELKAFDELQKIYTKTDNITFVIKPRNGNVFSKETLQLIYELTSDSWQLPYSTRVDSISNYQHTSAIGDDLTVIDLVEDPESLTEQDLLHIKNIVMNEPLLVHNLISEDEYATGINITFSFPEKDITEVPFTEKAVQKLLNEYKAKYPEFEIAHSGIVSLNNAFSEASQKDMSSLIPLMYIVLLIVMMLFLRSILATFATLIIISFSTVFSMGLVGWMGMSLSPPSAMAPTIILTLAIADSIHIIVSMFKAVNQGMDKRAAIIESVRVNIGPVFLTSITTAIGFLTLNFSDTPPFRDLGNITAIGILLAFLFSMILLPSLLSLLPISLKYHTSQKVSFIDKLGEFVIEKRNVLIKIMLITVIFLAIMIPRLEVNDRWVEYFNESVPFRVNTEFLMDNLTGIYRAQYSIPAASANGINDPKYLQKLDEFANWLRTREEVVHVYSITDIFKRLNRVMHGDDDMWYKIPESQEMAAQYLLLYEFSLPYGLDLNDRINIDKSATRISVILKGDTSTDDIKSFKIETEQWLKDNSPDYMNSTAISPTIMFAYIAERNIESMMKGNILALFLISLIIMIALRNISLGFYSLIPNLVPPIMGFGLWTIINGEVNMSVAFVTSIALGIIVDDTIHFLSKYHRARKERGLSKEDAVRYAFSTVGSALFITSLVLIAGFSILMLSAFKMNSLMGMLTAIIIACALIADFLLLPPILMLTNRKKKK